MKKLVVTLFILGLALVSYFVLQINQDTEAGQVRILVQDGDEVVLDDTLSFEADESLYDLMNREYDLVCANASYQASDECKDLLFGSPVILGIEDVMTDWNNRYFAIYINDEYSTLGVNNLILEDGDVVRFEVSTVGGD